MEYVKKLVVSIILHHCLLKLLHMICCSIPLWYSNIPTQSETARAQAGEWAYVYISGLVMIISLNYDSLQSSSECRTAGSPTPLRNSHFWTPLPPD